MAVARTAHLNLVSVSGTVTCCSPLTAPLQLLSLLIVKTQQTLQEIPPYGDI